MGRNNICVIYDSDEGYAKRLMQVINDDNCIPYSAQVFTQKEELERYLKNGQADMLMIGEADYEYGRADEKVVVLCEEEEEAEQINESGDESVVGVCKYQPTYQILQNVMKYERKERLGVRNSKIVGVYGINSADRLLLSVGVAKYLASKKQTLLISLEEFSALSALFESAGEDSLSDVFYIFRQNHKQFHKNMERAICHYERLDYIPGVLCADDITEMDVEDLRTMVKGIGRELGYDYVVVDMGSGVRKPWSFLSCCDAVYMPEERGYIEKLRMQALEQYFLERGMENIFNSFTKINVSYGDSSVSKNVLANIESSELYEDIQRKVVI